MTTTELVDLLSGHETLGSAPREELEWLAAHGTVRTFAEGDVLTKKGDTVDGMFIVLSGHIVIFVDRGGGPEKVMEWKAGDVTGMLPYSRMVTPPGNTEAIEPTVALAIHRDDLREMTRECYEVTAILVHKMVDRARQFKSSDLQIEKMASLGRLTARLAHELNNPAAAIERSASQLEDLLDEAERATLALGAARLTDAQLAAVDAIRTSCMARQVRGVLSPIQQAEREDAISDWLEDHGLPSHVAGTLAETAVTLDSLNQIATAVEGPSLEAVLRWAASGCSVRGVASEIQDAAMRISGLVQAVKGYTHMDQGTAAEPVNLATTLSSTIALFRSKARDKSVEVALDVPAGLPCVRGFVGELNQNLGEPDRQRARCRAPVRTGRGDGGLRAQHGRGSRRERWPRNPAQIRERIFEPFFTTKPVGKGTGQGLDIVRRLLPHNDAQIDVESGPGRTVFAVALPIAEPESKGGRP